MGSFWTNINYLHYISNKGQQSEPVIPYAARGIQDKTQIKGKFAVACE